MFAEAFPEPTDGLKNDDYVCELPGHGGCGAHNDCSKNKTN